MGLAQPEGKPVMEVEDLNMYYGSFKALADVSMKIARNKVTALIGPSGCGKSTFIRSLNRMHEVVSGARVEGRVFLDGEDIYAREVDPVRVRRRVGMVFQKPNPFPTMSIYDNVVAGLKLGRRRKKSELGEVVEHTLKQAALWGEVKNKLKDSGTSLSGGQQQRLCIARTLAMEPEVPGDWGLPCLQYHALLTYLHSPPLVANVHSQLPVGRARVSCLHSLYHVLGGSLDLPAEIQDLGHEIV